MKECLNFSLSLHGKECNVTLIYRSPSQSSEEFDTFLSNFELLLDYIANGNPFVSIITGDYERVFWHYQDANNNIFTSFDNGLEGRGVFLYISKAFDKVYHDGLIYKLKQNRIKYRLVCLLIDFWKNHQQRVVLNGQFSSWTKVNADVPQGSILEPFYF